MVRAPGGPHSIHRVPIDATTIVADDRSIDPGGAGRRAGQPAASQHLRKSPLARPGGWAIVTRPCIIAQTGPPTDRLLGHAADPLDRTPTTKEGLRCRRVVHFGPTSPTPPAAT